MAEAAKRFREPRDGVHSVIRHNALSYLWRGRGDQGARFSESCRISPLVLGRLRLRHAHLVPEHLLEFAQALDGRRYPGLDKDLRVEVLNMVAHAKSSRWRRFTEKRPNGGWPKPEKAKKVGAPSVSPTLKRPAS
jgi:hypothetical protein